MNEQPELQWDADTLVLIQRGGLYGRIIRLKNGQLLCSYEKGGRVYVCGSDNEGKSWKRHHIAAKYEHGAAANPEILQLQNGTIICSYNQRPRDDKHPFAITVCFSSDNGETWGGHKVIYKAGTDFSNGCWEPAQVQLAGGEIQLFFANENQYRQSNEQEITMLRSFDNGKTWKPPLTVSFRAGHRDGMPAPLVLEDRIVIAIEDNGLAGRFKPAIIETTLETNWKYGRPADGESDRRQAALKEQLPANVYAGAPCIRRVTKDITVLSVQSDEGGREEPQMVVYLGDGKCKEFRNRTVPFNIPSAVPGKWNSVFIKDVETITAVSSTTINNIKGLWAIDGRLVSNDQGRDETGG